MSTDTLTIDSLRRHIATAHSQGPAAYEGTDESVCIWHDRWEHDPRQTHNDHAHDELTARRLFLPLVSV